MSITVYPVTADFVAEVAAEAKAWLAASLPG